MSSKIKSKESLNYGYSLHENNRVKVEASLKFYNSYEFLDLEDFIKRQSELLNDKNRFLLNLESVQRDLEGLKYLNLDSLNFSYIKELYYENVLFSEVNFDESAYEIEYRKKPIGREKKRANSGAG